MLNKIKDLINIQYNMTSVKNGKIRFLQIIEISEIIYFNNTT